MQLDPRSRSLVQLKSSTWQFVVGTWSSPAFFVSLAGEVFPSPPREQVESMVVPME